MSSWDPNTENPKTADYLKFNVFTRGVQYMDKITAKRFSIPETKIFLVREYFKARKELLLINEDQPEEDYRIEEIAELVGESNPGLVTDPKDEVHFHNPDEALAWRKRVEHFQILNQIHRVYVQNPVDKNERYEEEGLEHAEQWELPEKISSAINTLPEDEQYVIRARFFEDKTLDEVGKSRNHTKEWARKLESQALRHLRHRDRSDKFEDFVDF